MNMSISRVCLTLVLTGLFFLAPQVVAVMLVAGLFYLLADAVITALTDTEC